MTGEEEGIPDASLGETHRAAEIGEGLECPIQTTEGE